jgi:periplasmic protein TonB
VNAAFSGVATPGSLVAGQPVASTSSSAARVQAASNAGLPVRHGIGAASAPAPAREVQNSHGGETLPAAAPEVVAPPEKPAETAPSASSSYAGSAPSFTFGGANAPEESSGANKKVLIGVAAAVLAAGVLYFGWTKFQDRSNQPVSTVSQTSPAPVPAPQIPKPSAKADSAIPSTPVPSASLPSSQPEAAPAKNQPASDTATTSDEPASAPTSTKSSSSISSAASKPAPLVLKGGTTPVLQVKSSAPDAPAPSMIGIATAGAGAPPPDLGSTQGSARTPVLQTLNVSQGVSQGLLTKKIQPVYPRNALAMHLEGSVELQATISKSGDISRVKVLSGDGQLAKAASDAVKQWKYKPYLLNGEPVEIQTQVTINFKLPR